MNQVETFFGKIGSWLKAKFKKLPSLEVQISSAINFCLPYVEGIDVLVAPEVAVLVNPILDRIKTGFAALAVTIQGSTLNGTSAATCKSIVASITANLAALEATAGVKDTATQQKLSGILTILTGELNAIDAAVGQVI